MTTIELSVQGMSCASCVKHITAALSPLTGVSAVEVNLETGHVRVSGSPDTEVLLATLNDAGYPAHVATSLAPVAAKAGGCGSRGGCCCH